MAVWEPTRSESLEKSLSDQPAQARVQMERSFAAMSATRLLVFGGIALIVGGMVFGDLFAVFVLHQNGNATGATLLAASQAVARQDPAAVKIAFRQIGGLLEDHGTKVDTHVHMSDAGYLALLLALVQPYVRLRESKKKLLAKLFLVGCVALPIGIFLIHYVGLAYSPSTAIGWASVLADSAGALMIIATIAFGWGLCNPSKSPNKPVDEHSWINDRSWERRALLSGGTLLILCGFVHGAWYAGAQLYEQEAREPQILSAVVDAAASDRVDSAEMAVNNYGFLAAEKALQIAAHSHFIEFGLLSILLSFVQPYIFLGSIWKRRWVKTLLAGSVILPIFVLLELRFGLIAGGIADIGGLMVIVALVGMLVGVVRCTGELDAREGASL
jgi:hypothetical protein